MRKSLALAFALAGASGALLLGTAVVLATDGQRFDEIERGRTLAVASDCVACHTVEGGQPFAGGRPIETPFGAIVAPNITPDLATGIGSWSDVQFDDAIRRGVRPDGSRLYPAMPFTAYTKMSRQDVLAIRAYLQTVQPVTHAVVANTLPFPFNIRTVMRVWDALYFVEGEFQPVSGRSVTWNRGAFLVNGPGHCGACHTPKTFLGGDKADYLLEGAALQGWFAPDITNNAVTGLGKWSADDVVAYLKTGHNGITGATGPMAEEVADSSSQMGDDDLKAIAEYLKSLPGHGNSTSAKADGAVMAAGQAIYRDECSACHGLEGDGVLGLFPSLAVSSALRAADPGTVIRIILRGGRSVATAGEPTGPGMPAFGWQLDDIQIAALATYLRQSWGSAAAAVSTKDVRTTRTALATRSD